MGCLGCVDAMRKLKKFFNPKVIEKPDNKFAFSWGIFISKECVGKNFIQYFGLTSKIEDDNKD